MHGQVFGGGEGTGPSTEDRRKPGTKYTPMTYRNGVLLAVRLVGSNRTDQQENLSIIEGEFPHVGGKHGRSKIGPTEVYADAGCDGETTREVLRCLGKRPHIRNRGTPGGSGLGRVRWIVERSVAWLKGPRRLRLRYD